MPRIASGIAMLDPIWVTGMIGLPDLDRQIPSRVLDSVANLMSRNADCPDRAVPIGGIRQPDNIGARIIMVGQVS